MSDPVTQHSGVTILGIGNVLYQDDGIGVMLLKQIEARYRFPDHLELVDGGTAGAALDRSLAHKEWVLVLDALAIPGEPGEVRVLPGDAFIQRLQSIKMSPHQVGFLDLIQLMGIEGTAPKRVDLIGVIPQDTDYGTEMSAPVRNALADAESALLDLLKQEKIVPEKREPPGEIDCWWL